MAINFKYILQVLFSNQFKGCAIFSMHSDFSCLLLLQMFPDNACKREIQKLVVRCRYAKNNGCPWTGTLSNEDIHYIACDYRDEQCPDCGSYMMWTKLKKHAEMECPMRRIMCRHCGEFIAVSHEKV